jgi:hypothetical protein
MIAPIRHDHPVVRFLLSDDTGAGVTGIANSDSNLRIAVVRDNGTSIAVYAGANILSIPSMGSYSDPGSSAQCRWGEVNATYFPGLYELQLNATFVQQARAHVVCRVYDNTNPKRWKDAWAQFPIYMPTRVDYVRDTLQTSKDLGAMLDVAVSTRAAPGDAMTLTAAERTAVAQAILNQAAVAGYSVQQVFQMVTAVLSGKAEKTPTGSRFRDVADTKWVVTVDHDTVGNRTSVIYNP